MKTWSYVAYSSDGKRAKGVIVAATEAQATADLKQKGLFTESLTAKADNKKTWSIGKRGLSADMRSVFLRQMAVMLDAGLTVAQALETIAKSGTNPQIERMANETRAALMGGDSFSHSLHLAEPGFPPYCICALEAGEESGRLAEVTETLATYFETARIEKASVANAMIYPAFVAVVAVIVALTLMRTVAPEIARLYSTMDRDLPQITQVLMGATSFLFDNAALLAAGVAGFVFAFVMALRRPGPRRVWDRMWLRVPLAGRFMRMGAAAQYLRTLAVMVQSRQPIALGIESAQNVLTVEDFITDARAACVAVQRGQSLSKALVPLRFIPPMAQYLIGAGEDSGRLAHMVDRAAALMERDLNNERKQVIALLEPLMMVLIGAMVLTIVLAVLLPIFDLQADIMP